MPTFTWRSDGCPERRSATQLPCSTPLMRYHARRRWKDADASIAETGGKSKQNKISIGRKLGGN